MIFEQPKELNRFLLPRTKWTPARAWALVRILLPILVMLMLLCAESRWLDGLTVWPAFAIWPLCVPIFGAMIWGSSRFEQGRSRKLQWDERYVRCTLAMPFRIRWGNVLGFRFEPAGPRAEWTLLSVQYRVYKKQAADWGMILDAVQREALLSELRRRTAEGAAKFDIVELASAPVEAKKEFRVYSLPIWLSTLGLVLCLNSLPFLAAGLLPLPLIDKIADPNPPPHPQIMAWLAHFPTIEARRHFLALIGAALLVAGLGCIWLSSVLSKRHKRREK